MKVFSFILAIYFFGLSSLPCSDLHNECNEAQSKTSITQDHDHNQDQDDNCSPFCTCVCCSASLVLVDFALFQFKVHSVISFKKTAIQRFFIDSKFYGNIWQPPKKSANC